MSQQLPNTEGWEDDKGQEQSCPAPPQQIPAATAMSTTRMPVPAAPAAGSADIEMPASMDNTTTSSSMRVQSQIENLYHSVPVLQGHIRLLQLLPNEDEDAAIHCRLFRTALDSGGTRLYEALSYVWGSGDKPRSIFVNGCELAVGGNLYAALLHLRDPFIERTIWIDAICINQEDPEEKGHQVQSMAKIYAKAIRVIVWLGEEAADSSQALEEIRIAADVERFTRPPDNNAGILALLQRPWFQRIWVLQEVAAARHILIKCGSAELDGFAFCSGLYNLDRNLSNKLRADLRARILSVTYLIRGAVFRPKYATTCQTDNFSLDIRPLGELIEMYHTREATDRRDKVYALLGMSSDNPIAAGLSADYTISWKQLFNKLIQFSLFQLVSVHLWDDKEIAVIEGKGCVLGEVSSVERNRTWKDRQDVTIIWRRGSVQYEFCCILPTTPKSIQKGDVVCLLQGASRPTILRPCNDHWAVTMIAVSLAGDLHDIRRHTKWSELLQSVTVFPHDFLLIWDWDLDPDRLRYRNIYDYYCAIVPVPEHSFTELEGCLDAATRIRNVRLVLQEEQQYKAADERLREEMTALERASRNMSTPKKDCLGPGDSEKKDAKKLETMVNQLIKEEGQWKLLWLAAEYGHEMFMGLLLDTDKFKWNSNWGSKAKHKALFLAAENGHKAIVEMLLGTGRVDVNDRGLNTQAALYVAAGNGHKAVVQLLLDSGKVDANEQDANGQTALRLAAAKRHEAVVKLLLDSYKVNPNLQDKYGWTVLRDAAKSGNEEVVKLLLDSGKVDVNLQNNRGGTALHDAARGAKQVVTKLLLDTGKVDVNLKIDKGVTALHLAASKGHKDVVELLLDTGKVNANEQDMDGQTALHLAAKEGHKAVIELLLDSGKIDVYIQDEKGETALDCARRGGYRTEAVVELLTELGISTVLISSTRVLDFSTSTSTASVLD